MNPIARTQLLRKVGDLFALGFWGIIGAIILEPVQKVQLAKNLQPPKDLTVQKSPLEMKNLGWHNTNRTRVI